MRDLNWNKISRRVDGAYGMDDGHNIRMMVMACMSYDSNVAHMIVNLKFDKNRFVSCVHSFFYIVPLNV